MSKENYIPTIGLEIHAELKTKTKMFCDCINDPDEIEPNVNVCSICLGHPGTLPVLNKEAIKKVLKIGLAVGGEIADFTEWDRKNYFYPDIPKGYQISQYKYPLVRKGKIGNFELTRIHLEEDTGSSTHDQGDFSLLNYNRAGVPLMELVTEPVIHSAKDASHFAKELQLLLRYLDASFANMEKGEMRVEANISVAKKDAKELGTKVEVKNLNSFKAVERAIDFEIERMINLIEDGQENEIVQETRGWDENKQQTFSQRFKESSDDYRYFPDPDLPKLKISEISDFNLEDLKQELVELPWEKRVRYLSLGIQNTQADMLVSDKLFYELFEGVTRDVTDENKIKLAANYISSDLVSLYKENGTDIFSKINPAGFNELLDMIIAGELSSRGAKDTLGIYVQKGGNPKEIASQNNFIQKNDMGEIEKIVDQIIGENTAVVEEFKQGKEASLQYLIGQGMKLSKGSANPQVLKEILTKKI